jgi:hypothetical protein
MAAPPPGRAFSCPTCEEPATASPRGQAHWDGYEGDVPVNPPSTWTLVQCDRCGRASLEVTEDFGDGVVVGPTVVFPAPHRISPHVPAALRREWEEARTCFNVKAYTACAVMARRTLEGTCKDQGVNARTLSRGLEAMRAHGVIDGLLGEWADALRVLGNQGAHFTGRPVTREDAEDSLAFAEALLDHVYVLRERFLEFKQRLKK